MRFQSPPETLACYAQHTPNNQTITNFRVHPREHPKECILLNIIELPGIDVGGLAYLARRIKQNVSSRTYQAKRIWQNESGTTHQARRVSPEIPLSGRFPFPGRGVRPDLGDGLCSCSLDLSFYSGHRPSDGRDPVSSGSTLPFSAVVRGRPS